MTEVPEKETGVTPRRRRPRRGEIEERVERPVVEAIESDGEPVVGLVALPGEKLSRATFDAPIGSNGPSEDGVGQELDDDRQPGADRRRRRRGGRGRGRGGRLPGEPMPGEPIGGPVPLDEVALGGEPMGGPVPLDEVALGGEPLGSSFADEVPTLPQHSGFGSVWDSQIGVSPRAASRLGRRRGPRGRAGGAGVPPGREAPAGTPPPRRSHAWRRRRQRRWRLPHRDRSRALRSRRFCRLRLPRSGSQPGRWRSTTLVRPAVVSAVVRSRRAQPVRRATSAEPWSEVPPDVQELLRAEVTRRQNASSATPASSPPPATSARSGSVAGCLAPASAHL